MAIVKALRFDPRDLRYRALIGVGGIMNAQMAKEKLEAGASLIQAYTGFVYGGPSFPKQVLSLLS